MERQKFEDSFRDAFQHAEVSPADNVWTNIELNLERQAGDKMKRRVLFFKWVAAASVVFAMAAGGVGYYVSQDNSSLGTNAGIAGNKEVNDDESNDNRSLDTPEETNIEDVSGTQKNVKNNNSDLDNIASEESSSEDPSIKQKSDGIKSSDSHQQSILKKHSPVDASSNQRSMTAIDDNTSKNNLSTGDQQSTAGKTIQTESKSPNRNSRVTEKADEFATENLAVNSKDINDAGLETAISKDKNDKNAGRPEMNNAYPGNALKNSTTGNSFPADNLAGGISREREEAILKSKTPRARLVEKQEVVLSIPKPEQSSLNEGELLLLELAILDEKSSKEKTFKGETIWTSVGFAAGSFSNTSFGAGDGGAVNPSSLQVSNIRADALLDYANQSSSKTNSSLNSGVAYSVGVNVGGRISEHWVLQGGLNYITRQSDYTSDAIVTVNNRSYEASSYLNNSAEMKAAGNAFNTLDAQSFNYTEQFQVNNTMQLISFPVQAGYILVNKKVNVQVNGGIATDLFIKNTVSADGSGLSEITNHREEESPFRPLNFSGLIGTEVSYRFSDHYRLSINPGVRYPFNSIYKSETQLNVNPITFDVGLKFLYIFR